jgi:hypothetical protein
MLTMASLTYHVFGLDEGLLNGMDVGPLAPGLTGHEAPGPMEFKRQRSMTYFQHDDCAALGCLPERDAQSSATAPVGDPELH